MKRYIAPSLKVTCVVSTQIMAGSEKVGLNKSYSEGGQLGKDRNDDIYGFEGGEW